MPLLLSLILGLPRGLVGQVCIILPWYMSGRSSAVYSLSMSCYRASIQRCYVRAMMINDRNDAWSHDGRARGRSNRQGIGGRKKRYVNLQGVSGLIVS